MSRIPARADQYSQENFKKVMAAQMGWFGLNQTQLAGKLGVTAASVGNYKNEPEKMQICVFRKMVKILQINCVSILMLLGFSEKEIRRDLKEYLEEA